MAVRAGRYRHRIEVRKEDNNQRDEYGGVTGHITVQRPWCSVTNVSETENVGEVTTSIKRLMFEMRYSKELANPTSDMFIIFKGEKYDIEGVDNPYELDEKLKMTAVRRRTGSSC